MGSKDGSGTPRPQFSILPVVRTPNVDPGEELRVAVYLTGSGPVDGGKLYVRYPYGVFGTDEGDTADDSTVGQFEYTVRWIDGETAAIFDDPSDDRRELKTRKVVEREFEHGGVIDVTGMLQSERELVSKLECESYDHCTADEILDPIYGGPLDTVSGEPYRREAYPMVLGERAVESDGQQYPPCLMRLYIKPRRPLWRRLHKRGSYLRFWDGWTLANDESGDYALQMVLTYTDDEQTYQSASTAEFHVNSFVESHRTALELLAVGAVFLTFIALVLQVVPFLR